MRRVSGVLLTIGVMVLGLVYGCQRRMLFPGGGPAEALPLAQRVPGAIALDVEHTDGRSEGVLLKGDGVVESGPVVVFAHGNGELIDQWAQGLQPYLRRGISVALLEYRGYGRSGGSASQVDLADDLSLFVDLLKTRTEVDPQRIAYHGRSLGGGVVSAVSARHPPRALILESTFTSITAIARGFWIPGFLVRDPFDSLAALAEWRGPSLVIHGRLDRVVPFSHGQALAQRPNATLLARDCGHNDCPRDAVYWQAIDALLARSGMRR